MKNNLTVKELISKKEKLEVELLHFCRNRTDVFRQETGRSIERINMLILDVSNINRQDRKEYFLTDVTISIVI